MIVSKRFDINFTPLNVASSLSVKGSLPPFQTYNADAATDAERYTPDFTIANLYLLPKVEIEDKDGILQSGNVNADLEDIVWKKIVDGVETTVPQDKYDTSGSSEHGCLCVDENVAMGHPATYVFTAKYRDTRTNQVFDIYKSIVVRCTNATPAQPKLDINVPTAIRNTDIEWRDYFPINATVTLGGNPLSHDKYRLVWEVWDEETHAWELLGSDETKHFWAIGYDTSDTDFTIRKSWTGHKQTIRCRVNYSASGTFPSIEDIPANAPTKIFSVIRQVPKFEAEISDMPTNISPDVTAIFPTVKLNFADTYFRLLSDSPAYVPWLDITWKMGINDEDGTPSSYQTVNYGLRPKIPVAINSTFDINHGAVVCAEVNDAGPLLPIEDNDNSILVDSDGYMILAR